MIVVAIPRNDDVAPAIPPMMMMAAIPANDHMVQAIQAIYDGDNDGGSQAMMTIAETSSKVKLARPPQQTQNAHPLASPGAYVW